MSIQWETEFLELLADDELDDELKSVDTEEDDFGCGECANDPCFGDWFRLAF